MSAAQYQATRQTKRQGRYGASKAIKTPQGKFDSRDELNRWNYLLLLEKAGEIIELERQVEFSFDLNDCHIASYMADHVYKIKATGEKIVEDFKGEKKTKTVSEKTGQRFVTTKPFTTEMFAIKKKMMKAFYGLEICLVTKVQAAPGSKSVSVRRALDD